MKCNLKKICTFLLGVLLLNVVMVNSTKVYASENNTKVTTKTLAPVSTSPILPKNDGLITINSDAPGGGGGGVITTYYFAYGSRFNVNNSNGDLIVYLSDEFIDRISAAGTVSVGVILPILGRSYSNPYSGTIATVLALNWGSIHYYAVGDRGVSIKLNSGSVVLKMQSGPNMYM